ncbi:MAG: glycosyltransferase [Bacteroidota bacterium]|nr:glycosyltransferase [Bacteroidota bacterium]
MIVEYLLIIVTSLLIIEFIILLVGLVKSTKTKHNDEFEPSVTIIVAARNEEHSIKPCLESLSKLNYPVEKLEIIVVNDQSSDGTEKIIKDHIINYPHFKLINSTPDAGNLIGKVNAVTQGIEATKNEFILFTDADCVLPKNWVKQTVHYFQNQVGVVGGFTILDANNTFEGIQSLDWIYLFSVGSAAATLGFPLTGVGNNLAVRRKDYEQTGGYRVIPFSVTEDYALTQAIVQKNKSKMVFPLDEKTLVTSLACPTWKNLFRQKQRWGVGGLDMVTMGFVVFSLPFAFNLLIIAGIFLFSPSTLILALVSKMAVDSLFLTYALHKLKLKRYMKYFFAFELYLFIYSMLLPFVAILTKKIIWKERSL